MVSYVYEISVLRSWSLFGRLRAFEIPPAPTLGLQIVSRYVASNAKKSPAPQHCEMPSYEGITVCEQRRLFRYFAHVLVLRKRLYL